MEQDTTCQHHWFIEAATGPTSLGVCQMCGAEQHFNNSADATWSQYARKSKPARASTTTEAPTETTTETTTEAPKTPD